MFAALLWSVDEANLVFAHWILEYRSEWNYRRLVGAKWQRERWKEWNKDKCTSCGKIIFVVATNGHTFEVRTRAEKYTKRFYQMKYHGCGLVLTTTTQCAALRMSSILIDEILAYQNVVKHSSQFGCIFDATCLLQKRDRSTDDFLIKNNAISVLRVWQSWALHSRQKHSIDKSTVCLTFFHRIFQKHPYHPDNWTPSKINQSRSHNHRAVSRTMISSIRCSMYVPSIAVLLKYKCIQSIIRAECEQTFFVAVYHSIEPTVQMPWLHLQLLLSLD